MTTNLGPATASTKTVWNHSGSDIPKGVAVELDTGAVFLANKYNFDRLAGGNQAAGTKRGENKLCVQLPSGNNTIIGVTTEIIADGESGQVVCEGFVQVIADNITTINVGATIITATGEFDDGVTGIHSNASFGVWMEAGVADALTWIYFAIGGANHPT